MEDSREEKKSITTPKHGEGRFQWNTGGWFGAQLGSSCYLLILSLLLLAQKNILAGVLILFCFLAANFIGYRLWANRARIKPFQAIQVLMLTLFAFSLLAFVFVELFLKRVSLHKVDVSPTNYLILLLFPVLMLLFWLVERGGGKGDK